MSAELLVETVAECGQFEDKNSFSALKVNLSGPRHSQYHCVLFQDIAWSKTTAAGWGFPQASGRAYTWNETQISYSLCLSRSLVGFWRLMLIVLAWRCSQPIFNTASLYLNVLFDAFQANICHIITSLKGKACEMAFRQWKKIWSNKNEIVSSIVSWNFFKNCLSTEYESVSTCEIRTSPSSTSYKKSSSVRGHFIFSLISFIYLVNELHLCSILFVYRPLKALYTACQCSPIHTFTN